VQRLGVLFNLDRTAEYIGAVEQAFEAAHDVDEPYLNGHLHALAALAARFQGAPEKCVTHLVQATRYLRAVQDPDWDTAIAWHDAAMAYSYLGFHEYALNAIARARELGAAVGIVPESLAAPGIRLRAAVARDHDGDSEGCLRGLRELAAELAAMRRTGSEGRLRPSARVNYGYALARAAVLASVAPSDVTPPQPDPKPLLVNGGDGARARDLRQLGEVCTAIAAGRPVDALARLESLSVSSDTLGAPELARLRSLAYQRAGDHAAAHQADRMAFRLAAHRSDRLRDVFVDGISARLAHQALRRTVARYADEALTDPLTGLPNRRHLERYVAAMVERGEHAVVGMCDLDGFKAVNTEHGHLSGDLVLQRVAGVLARVLRQGDFVARYGGDEFVVVLPGADVQDADEMGRRITVAVGGEDWDMLVPGTPVGVSVGWAEVTGTGAGLREALLAAFETADLAMLRSKKRPRQRRPGHGPFLAEVSAG
jgi:diguanylate cyclase (GGDEF)-like protein